MAATLEKANTYVFADLVEAAYVAALAAIPDTPAKAQGILIGQAAAAAILDLRDADGANTPPFLDFTYVPGPNPGDFQFIPGLPFAAFPGWGNVTPFVLTSSSQYRPKAPYSVSSKKYAGDFNEVKTWAPRTALLAPPNRPRSPCSG